MDLQEDPVESNHPRLSDCNGDSDARMKKLSIKELDSQHSNSFIRGLGRVMSTDLSQLTYAQIIDGLPLIETVNNSNAGSLPHNHPLYKTHENLCAGVMERTEEICTNFDPDVLKFDSWLIFAYQSASPGSKMFRMRLIEMIAIAIHQIAVILFKLDTSLHKDDGITEWAPRKEDTLFWQYSPNGPPPTLFNHAFYRDYGQYPDGVADIAGYWAESRILGGVVLFDRGTPNRKPDTEAVFLHPDREEVTYRIYRLLESQKNQLLDFLLSDTPGPSPFPILASMENTHRVDPEDDIEETGVYRDIWERKPLPLDCPDGRLHCVWDPFNFPTWDEWQEAKGRCMERRNRPEP